MSGLWRDHPATAHQQALVFKTARGSRKASQADVLASMLRKARGAGAAVQLPEIMAAGIAQHGARLNELRARGFVIENELKRAPDGRVFSRYWLRFDPEQDGRE